MNLPVILRVFKGDHIVEVKQFQLDQIVIGNQADVNLNLSDPSVSPIHALIEKRNETYYVCDLGSEKGTFKGQNQILDDILESGDELLIGDYRVLFSVGVPKPKIQAPDAIVSKVIPTVPPPLIAQGSKIEIIEEDLEPTNSVEPVVTEKKPVLPTAPVIQEAVSPKVQPAKNTLKESINQDRPLLDKEISINKTTSVAPDLKPRIDSNTIETKKSSVQTDENQVIKASKGSVLEVSVAWKERIIETYHFRGNKSVTVGSSGKVDIPIPSGVFSGVHTIVDFQSGTASVNLSSSMLGNLILERNSYDIEHLRNQKRMTSNSRGQNVIRLEQGEAFKVALDPGVINIYIRFVPSTQKPSLVPFVPFTTGEIASVLLATALVGLVALYNLIHAPVETPKEELQPEIISVTKFVYPTVKPPAESSVTPPPLPPPVKVETPPKEKKKLVMGDQTKVQVNSKENKPATTSEAVKKGGGGTPGSVAAEASPNKNTSAKKTFTSVQQGGAVKLGAQAGANAAQKQKPVDLSTVGLTSTFGGGGASNKLKQAVQGAGGIIGDANQATGTAGFSKNRPGDDLGSAFKDTGAGGKGVATEGISGGITNGRGSGNSGYGGVGTGLGNKAGVNVDVGGYGMSFVGTVDRNAIIRVIQNNKSVIRRCYERELRFKNNLTGRVMVKFEFGDTGKVLKAEIVEGDSTLKNKEVETCLRNEIVNFQFQPTPANSIAEVSYPFNFQNGE